MVRRLVLLVAATAALALSACSGTTGLVGADLYGQSCAGCHGDDGGGAVGPALGTGSRAGDLSDGQIADVIVVGPGAMPGFRRLSGEQIDSLVAHIRSLQTP